MDKHIAELLFFILVMISKSYFLEELNEELLLLHAHTLSKS
jgi:hypothetical protein